MTDISSRVANNIWNLASRMDVIRYARGRPAAELLMSSKTPAEISKSVDMGPIVPDRSVTLTQGPEQVDATYPENEMMVISISSILTESMKAVSMLVKDAVVSFGPTGIDIIHLQSPPGAYILLNIKGTDLERYRIRDGQTFTFAMNLENFVAIMKDNSGGDIKMLSDAQNKLFVHKSGRICEFLVEEPPRIGIDISVLPSLDKFHTELCVPASEMKALFPSHSKKGASESVNFNLIENGLTIVTKKKTGPVQKTFNAENRTPVGDSYYFTKFSGGNTFVAQLNLDSITNVFKLMGTKKTVSFAISNEGVVELRSTYGQLSSIKVYIPYMETQDDSIASHALANEATNDDELDDNL